LNERHPFALQPVETSNDPKGEFRMGWEATATVNRSDFEVKPFVTAVSDEEGLRIAVEGIKQ
jgi:polyisoprenoid-binding protein YceI